MVNLWVPLLNLLITMKRIHCARPRLSSKVGVSKQGGEGRGEGGCRVDTKQTNFGLDVIERGGADDGKADQENIGLGVRERSQPVVILLSSGIPKAETDRLSVDHNTSGVVVEAGEFMLVVMINPTA